jgi:hypothetical protein
VLNDKRNRSDDDSDNRLTSVYSDFTQHQELSHADDYLRPLPGQWERDAHYQYYNHGPLGRVELGDKQVQGLDYLYNIQGWLKGVNSSTAETLRDDGRDASDASNAGLGAGYSHHTSFGADAFGYSLHDFDGNYAPVGDGVADCMSTPDGYLDDANNHRDLYNGNISAMTSAIYLNKVNYANGGSSVWVRNYRYDQLNRIKAAQSYMTGFMLDAQGNDQPTQTTNQYNESFSFDLNGNITNLRRNGDQGNFAMDNLQYRYYQSDGGEYDATVPQTEEITNRLAYVVDGSGVAPGSVCRGHGIPKHGQLCVRCQWQFDPRPGRADRHRMEQCRQDCGDTSI